MLYAQGTQTTEQLIERLARRLQLQGQILVVTSHPAKPIPLRPGPCRIIDCFDFIQTVEAAIHDLQYNISAFNEKERAQFNRTH